MDASKVVIITGASSGIGKALAEQYARRGWHLALGARRVELLEAMKPALEAYGSRVICQATDVSKETDCKRLIEAAVDNFGKIDILINNAGVSMRALFRDVELEVLRRLMDVNFWGTVYCTKYALPYLLQSQGSVVGVISIAGYVGLPGRTGYSASKFAVRGFLETLRTENLKTGLHVLIAAPGFTATDIRFTALTADGTPQGASPRKEDKMMSADAVARCIIRAVDRRKNSLILTFLEGKFTVFLHKFFPGLVARLAYRHMAKEPDSPFK